MYRGCSVVRERATCQPNLSEVLEDVKSMPSVWNIVIDNQLDDGSPRRHHAVSDVLATAADFALLLHSFSWSVLVRVNMTKNVIG